MLLKSYKKMWFQSVAKVIYTALKFLDGIQSKLN